MTIPPKIQKLLLQFFKIFFETFDIVWIYEDQRPIQVYILILKIDIKMDF
jgi:hypothetical protein